MGEIKFVDTTFRDGNQSLWGATGFTAGNILAVAPAMDNAGFKAIELTSSIHMGISVRYHKENPWEKMRLIAKAITKTPLIFGTTGRRFIGFKRMPDSIMSLVMERVAASGVRRVWILDAAHEVKLFNKTARLVKAVGIEEVVAVLCFSISPVHTDEYYARVAVETARSADVDILCLEDQGGLLTPQRVRTLIPALKEAAGGKTLEVHFHCNTGLAPLCYLEAVKLGVNAVQTAVAPLANGTSLPSAESILDNLPYLNYGAGMDEKSLQTLPALLLGTEKYWGNLDRDCLGAVSAHLRRVCEVEGRPQGQPAEHHASYYIHQVPGGMMSTLIRQLAEMQKEELLPRVLEEVARVRRELGYPVMATPFSQFVGTQATMNVLTGERYKVIPTGIIEYACEWFGPPTIPIEPAIFDRIISQPPAKEIFGQEFPQPSITELRREMGLGSGVSDEEFLLRYTMTDLEVDQMLAAGPINTNYPVND